MYVLILIHIVYTKHKNQTYSHAYHNTAVFWIADLFLNTELSYSSLKRSSNVVFYILHLYVSMKREPLQDADPWEGS